MNASKYFEKLTKHINKMPCYYDKRQAFITRIYLFCRLALDISTGILFKSLLNHKLVSVPPAEKAKAALETAVEFLFSQYSICLNRKMSLYKVNNSDPGQALGDFMLSLATDAFNQRFVNKKLFNVIQAQPACTASPVRDLKV